MDYVVSQHSPRSAGCNSGKMCGDIVSNVFEDNGVTRKANADCACIFPTHCFNDRWEAVFGEGEAGDALQVVKEFRSGCGR